MYPNYKKTNGESFYPKVLASKLLVASITTRKKQKYISKLYYTYSNKHGIFYILHTMVECSPNLKNNHSCQLPLMIMTQPRVMK